MKVHSTFGLLKANSLTLLNNTFPLEYALFSVSFMQQEAVALVFMISLEDPLAGLDTY